MEYGRFIDKGDKYEILTPYTPNSWKNILFNDSYYLEVSQTLQGEGRFVKNYIQSTCMLGGRFFYIKDRVSGKVWNPNLYPLMVEPEKYSCMHGLYETVLTSVTDKIETSIKVMVPLEGKREIWTVTICNRDAEKRQLSFYTAFRFYDHGVMGGECYSDKESGAIIKYAVPYHVRFEERDKAMEEEANFFFLSDLNPDSYEFSQRRFFGPQGQCGIPAGVKNETLTGIKAEAEDFLGAMQFNLMLNPGEEILINFEAGASLDLNTIREEKEKFNPKYVETKEKELEEYWTGQVSDFYVETPDENLNYFANYWLKKQILLLTRQNRGGTYCPVRNQLQDAMGYAMIDPKAAKKYFCDVLKLQNQDGFLQQWYDTSGAPKKWLCLLKHADGPVWLVICTEAFISQSGDAGLLNEEIEYADGGKGPVLQHLERALLYLKDAVGSHGMCLMYDGDWTDPINGAGREGKGESVWLSMAFVYGVKRLSPYLKDSNKALYEMLKQAAETMKDAINTHAWCGSQYAVAIHDDGTLLGDEQDRLFLNTQSWAIISGTADKEKTELLLKSVKEKLATPFGPLLLYPPFMDWDKHWGRISIKKAGTTENGSVYCHASMFYAYAEALLGDGCGLYDTLWRTLPTNQENAVEKNLQLPNFLSNYYYGLRESANFGRSSGNHGTGTVAWMLKLISEDLLGIKASIYGIKVEPCIPKAWNYVKVTKKFKNACYEIEIIRGSKKKILVNGKEYTDDYLPYEEGEKYKVEITLMS